MRTTSVIAALLFAALSVEAVSPQAPRGSIARRQGKNNGKKAAQQNQGQAAQQNQGQAAQQNQGQAANKNGGGGGGGGGAGGADTSLTLDPKVIQTGSAQDGAPSGGQVASTTSTNNFINFCVSADAKGAPLMNGTQTKAQQACNPIPMGMIVSQNKMPSCKFTNPKNLDTIKANESFDINMKISNIVTGNFVNPQTNYFASPAQVDDSGTVIGHSHFVVEAIDSMTSTTVTDPKQFAFFKGVDPPAANGVLTVNVPGGLPAGTYRLSSINAAANHQPVLATIAQHGSFDDAVYFTAK